MMINTNNRLFEKVLFKKLVYVWINQYVKYFSQLSQDKRISYDFIVLSIGRKHLMQQI